MSRKHHFHEGAGNPILGYNTGDGTVCRDCGSNNVEFADIDPRRVHPIHLDDVGEGGSEPEGFTCVGCGDVIGDWDYKGNR